MKKEEMTAIMKACGVKPSTANLYRSRAVKADIVALDEAITRMESHYNSAREESLWFIHETIARWRKEKDCLAVRLAFLNEQRKILKMEEAGASEEEVAKARRYITYDKEAIKSIPITSILEEVGYAMIRTGSNRSKCICPFHNDTNPSFSIMEDKNFGHCFACGQSADVIKLYQHIHSLDFVQALKELWTKV